MYRKPFFIGFLSALCLIIGCSSPNSPETQKQDLPYFIHPPYTEFKNTDSLPKYYSISERIAVTLDSASTLRISKNISDTFLMDFRGKAHFLIHPDSIPVVIHTGMMKLNTKSVNLRLNAKAQSPGQSLKVFGGKLIATKSYKSDFPNTDTLSKGDLILINIDIDLMEKETFDTLTIKPHL